MPVADIAGRLVIAGALRNCPMPAASADELISARADTDVRLMSMEREMMDMAFPFPFADQAPTA